MPGSSVQGRAQAAAHASTSPGAWRSSGRLTDLIKDLGGRLRKIYLPPLVDRREDIPLLVRDYLRKTHAKTPDPMRHLLLFASRIDPAP